MRLAPLDAARAGAVPYLRALSEAAEALGGRLELETEHAFIGRYTPPGRPPRPILGRSLGLNADAAAALAGDKDYTARWLAAAGLPAPEGLLVFSPAFRDRMALKNAAVAERLPGLEAARTFAAAHGFPVVLKPNDGAQGRGVRVAADAADLEQDIAAGWAEDDRLRLEAHVRGRDYRLLVLEDRVPIAYERLPLSITGDGRRSVSALIADTLARIAASHRGAKVAADDSRLLRRLAAEGLDGSSVLAEGRCLPLLSSANLSTGGRLRDLSGQLPKAAEALAVAAVRSLGLTFAGVDILAPDLATGTEGAVILEVNASPGLDFYAAEGPEHFARTRDVLHAALSRLG
ncbi:hypothetical protein [Tropicimonas sediminicola]|uniref:Cyanophycin synthetase n=1 Tax=Tropicimonas sediminicola TaxID=1031541 RepID=A0A239CM02_9RHOB|nr:hypothetical protein [Tropicimonas sediminicola]SNS21140.1 cyanophycin synthetase [Tropicimonas sediminicola]